MFTSAVVGLLIAAVAIALRLLTPDRKGKKLPPGPIRYPIIGNAGGIRTDHPHLFYHEMIKEYGDVVYLEVLSTPIVLLGSYEVCNQLLLKRGTIYSDRPASHFSDH
ncbi:hypothetical protein DL93DRAFT_2080073 [Clavulina sp. PMI_390]|nr:hypothetical protein DL93DRAFT_2080073 [Clavulina sp. PMI_390]